MLHHQQLTQTVGRIDIFVTNHTRYVFVITNLSIDGICLIVNLTNHPLKFTGRLRFPSEGRKSDDGVKYRSAQVCSASDQHAKRDIPFLYRLNSFTFVTVLNLNCSSMKHLSPILLPVNTYL